MIYTINEEICKKKGITVEELLVILLVKSGVNIDKLVNNMVSKELLVTDLFNKDKYLVTQRWDNVVTNVLLSGDTTIPDEESLGNLAVEMARLFPSGTKPGTHIYWKGNKKDNVQKLQKFFKLYNNYSFEDILKATKKYVDKYKNDTTTMRILKYFIMKDNESDLATILENMNEPDTADTQTSIDWDVELR